MATGLNLGLAAGTDIPVEHLDYGYVGECGDAKEVEIILQILRQVHTTPSTVATHPNPVLQGCLLFC